MASSDKNLNGRLNSSIKKCNSSLLAFSLSIFVFSSLTMKYKLRSYSIQVFELLTRVIKGGQLGAKLGTDRCGFWGLTERIFFLTWKRRHFDLEVACCFLPHEWKYRSLHLLASYNSFAYSLRFSCSRKWTSEKMADILRHPTPWSVRFPREMTSEAERALPSP